MRQPRVHPAVADAPGSLAQDKEGGGQRLCRQLGAWRRRLRKHRERGIHLPEIFRNGTSARLSFSALCVFAHAARSLPSAHVIRMVTEPAMHP